MNSLSHITKPLADLWNYYTHDANLEQLLSFRGGYSGGNEWHSKYLRSEQDVLKNEYDELSARFNEEPRLLDLVSDNKWRLTIFAGVERLISARQAHSGLKVRFYVPDNNRAVLQQIFNQGVLGGYFRGYLLNLAQFVGVGYHSLLWSHKTNYVNHLAISSLFEALLFPLDTIKTLIYADLQGKYKGYLDCLGKIVENNGYEHLWRGLSYKLIYNGFFVWNLRNIYEDSPLAYISTPAWLLSYAFLSFKTRLQVADTCLSFNNAENGDKYMLALTKNTSLRGLYGGLLPFAVLNLTFMWTFYGLYSKEAQERVAESFVERSREFRSPAAEKMWS